jgi:hypothetical protein
MYFAHPKHNERMLTTMRLLNVTLQAVCWSACYESFPRALVLLLHVVEVWASSMFCECTISTTRTFMPVKVLHVRAHVEKLRLLRS